MSVRKNTAARTKRKLRSLSEVHKAYNLKSLSDVFTDDPPIDPSASAIKPVRGERDKIKEIISAGLFPRTTRRTREEGREK